MVQFFSLVTELTLLLLLNDIIKFTKENEIYSVGWIAYVRSGLSVKLHQRLEDVLTLLSYVRENYSVIIDRKYCKKVIN